MAQKGVNKVILVGNLGQDPEVRYMPNGDAVARFNIATSESWKDRQTGQAQERTEWHRIVAFRKQAEIIGQYLKKGSKVYIEGKLRTRKWQDQSGQDRYTTEVESDDFQMLDSRGPEQGYQPGSTNHQNPQRQPNTSQQPAQPRQPLTGHQPAQPRQQPPHQGGGWSDDDYPF